MTWADWFGISLVAASCIYLLWVDWWLRWSWDKAVRKWKTTHKPPTDWTSNGYRTNR